MLGNLISSFILLLFFVSTSTHSPAASNDFAGSEGLTDWIRVRSDDGEFSVEVPQNYKFFYDKDGFWVSNSSNNYPLKNMNMLNAYDEGTLVSFESYEAKPAALDAIFDHDKRFPKEADASKFKRDGVTIHQITIKTDDYYCVRQYFNSKSHIYVLTSASRNGESSAMKRFLDSLIFEPDRNNQITDNNSVLFSALQPSSITITGLSPASQEDKKVAPPETEKKEPTAGNDISKLLIVKKQPASYTDAARKKLVEGRIQLLLTLDETGFIPKIQIVRTLPEGLTRQAIFAALRIKFLPQEENGQPKAVVKMVEYSFDIY